MIDALGILNRCEVAGERVSNSNREAVGKRAKARRERPGEERTPMGEGRARERERKGG